MNITSVALFCGSSSGNDEKYTFLAREFGKRCADEKITLYYGGASIGLMGAAAYSALENRGHVVGIAPSFFTQGVVLSETLPEMILVDSMSERKQQFEKEADAFVILPGSYGTMDEFFEVLTDAQLGLHNKPIVLLNAFGYYDHLINLLNQFRKEGFLRSFHHDLFLVAETVDDLFDKLEHYEYRNDQSWLDKIKRQG